VSDAERHPLSIETPPHLEDHHFEGRPVLPSVLALELLARAAQEYAPQLDVARASEARFLRFLNTSPGAPHVEAEVELVPVDGAGVRASLLTVHSAGQSGMTRAKEHLQVTFGVTAGELPPLPGPDALLALRQQGAAAPAARLYAELVPFGPSFQWAADPIRLAPGGATGRLLAPGPDEGCALPAGLLGSPHPLDAAMHLACAWGQRFCGAVTFPTGFGRRTVARPTEAGGLYAGCVVPRGDSGPGATPPLTFDLWIYGTDDASGHVVHEVVEGLIMEDLSRGRLQPPDWVRA
jgi:Polyketide synthase dehydratase domain